MEKVTEHIKALFVIAALSMVMAGGATVAGQHSFLTCSAEVELEPEEGAEMALESDPSSYTTINSFGQSYYGYLFMYGGPTYFKISTTDVEVIDLNYSGVGCSLSLYKAGHCNLDDAIMSISSLTASNQILVLDANTTYFIALSTAMPGSHYFSITPTQLSSTTPNLSEYVVHLSSDFFNYFGSSLSVERYQLSQTSSVETECSIMNRGVYSVADELSETLNFGYDITLDNRQVVSNTGYSHYSAIASGANVPRYWNGTNYIPDGKGFSGSFVSETTVLTCAHVFAEKTVKYVDDLPFFYSTISARNASFFPGESNYNLPSGSYSTSDYGWYDVTDVYLPLSYVLSQHGPSYSDEGTAGNDWAICLTTVSEQGSYTHSSLGIKVPTFSSFNLMECAGYPGLLVTPDDEDRTWMWTTVPPRRGVETHPTYPGLFVSDDLYSNGGSSGSPLFYAYSFIENGVLKRKTYQYGVLSGSLVNYHPWPYVFGYTTFTKNTHFMLNLYHVLEGTENEVYA
jgi:V8-like Glu-specific endopeptidase